MKSILPLFSFVVHAFCALLNKSLNNQMSQEKIVMVAILVIENSYSFNTPL